MRFRTWALAAGLLCVASAVHAQVRQISVAAGGVL
jgi:hypothetical protein